LPCNSARNFIAGFSPTFLVPLAFRKLLGMMTGVLAGSWASCSGDAARHLDRLPGPAPDAVHLRGDGANVWLWE
jgi:hypothetical protein